MINVLYYLGLLGAAAAVVIYFVQIARFRKWVRLVSAEHVASMKPGSVLVDLAVEQGGNVVGAKTGEIVETGGVKIVGIPNLPGRIAADASALYARNLTAFVGLLVKDGQIAPDFEDEILNAALVARDGAIVHALLKPV